MKLLRILTWILAAAWVVLLGSIIARADAAEVCTPAQMRTGSDLSDKANAHGEMCITTAHILARLVQQSHLPCNAVVGSILYPERKGYFVTCLVVDMTQRADRVQSYRNYQSTNGNAFEAAP